MPAAEKLASLRNASHRKRHRLMDCDLCRTASYRPDSPDAGCSFESLSTIRYRAVQAVRRKRLRGAVGLFENSYLGVRSRKSSTYEAIMARPAIAPEQRPPLSRRPLFALDDLCDRRISQHYRETHTHKFLILCVRFSQVMHLSTSRLKRQYSPPATHSTQ